MTVESAPENLDFVRERISADVKSGRNDGKVITRFPPEPNGYLHIGHAKAICLDFGVAQEYGGRCHLRFDDTNPGKEEQEYIDAIKEDIHWLGFDWGENEYYASDYYDRLYEWAVKLIEDGKAYVDDQSADEIRETRGTLTKPGRESLFRNRSVQENLDLFERMRNGEFGDGEKVLRARIDMAAPNINLRDPVMYRILHVSHPRTGDKWCIYPMYDWAHGQSDSIEGITHSLCDLDFENHRPLYDWFLDQLGVHHPQQIEFARLNITHTITSKRKLRKLIQKGAVTGWDDPRLPSFRGLRRRGYTAEAVKNFIARIGMAKRDSTVDMALLEYCIREDLNKHAVRRMVVLRPLRVIIDNYPKGGVEDLDAVNNPEDESAGVRKVPFSRELYIEKEDFMEDPPGKFYRLAPGREVRLRYAYFVTCTSVVKNETSGEITELHCTYDPDTKGGDAPDGRKVKATLHWVSAAGAVEIEARLYGHLMAGADAESVGEHEDFLANVNSDSLETLTGCRAEPCLAEAQAGERFQFERQGYFCVDPDSDAGTPVFNRTVTLRDTWGKLQKRGQGK